MSVAASVATWNAFDWVLLAIVAFSMAIAFRRGLVRAIFSLLGWVGGFQLASWSYTTIGDWVNDSHLIASPLIARIVGFLLVVVAVAAGFDLLGRVLQKTLRSVGLSPLDRTLGAAFGFARGYMIGIALLIVASTIAPHSEVMTTSVLSPYLFAVAHDVSFLVPQDVQQLMEDGAFDFKHNAPRWINRR